MHSNSCMDKCLTGQLQSLGQIDMTYTYKYVCWQMWHVYSKLIWQIHHIREDLVVFVLNKSVPGIPPECVVTPCTHVYINRPLCGEFNRYRSIPSTQT